MPESDPSAVLVLALMLGAGSALLCILTAVVAYLLARV